jgi:hypothetical protein
MKNSYLIHMSQAIEGIGHFQKSLVISGNALAIGGILSVFSFKFNSFKFWETAVL